MSKITQVTGQGIPLLIDDIDTDRIIPARFLRCVTFDGIGEHAFEDDRQQDPQHPFNLPTFRQGSILVSGRNFGCGSSREHAPQSLMRWGIKAVIAESFAEIFFGNCTALGIPAVTTTRTNLERITSIIASSPEVHITLDLLSRSLQVGTESFQVAMPDSAHSSLTTGKWDFLSELLANQEKIKSTYHSIPYLNKFVN